MARDRNRPMMLARRSPTPVERDVKIAQARAANNGEQNEVRVGRCGGCGGTMPGGCSCDVAGVRGTGIGWWRNFIAAPGCYPRGYTDKGAQDMLADEPSVQSAPEPYSDAAWDYVNMDVLYSPITSLAIGATTNIDITPQAGCFVAFYWRIIVRDPTSGIQSVDWAYQRPRIQGCPIPCDDIDRLIMGQFAMHVPEAANCCGLPLRAFIQRAAEALPLRTPVANQSAALLDGQIEVRGFCCSTRIC